MDRARLLVIDDDRGPRESLRYLFKDLYDVACASSVDEGVAAVQLSPPDAIIMDIKMPGKTGIQGLREIRAVDPLVSIVMLTGFGTLETAQEAIRHGATDYLKKPFETAEIREAVAGYIHRTQVARRQHNATRHLESLTRQLQDQLQAREKMAVLGEESSEFVHDLNNPLTVINGYVQMLLEDVKEKRSLDDELNIGFLEEIDKAVARCRDMLTLWRGRAQRTEAVIKQIDLGATVREIAQSAAQLAALKNACVRLYPGPDECRVEGDGIQVFRAIQNIVGNAIDAVPATGGTVDIRWRVEERRALVEVEDNGGGFPPDKLADMQTRHYTTKGASGGMGLGLFIAKNIMEAHGGTLDLANNAAGTGAFVTLAFPRLS